jgi:sugar phosphate isomerase/epimerase
MKLGCYTNYDKATVAFAQKVGFRSMELSAWPGSSLNADTLTDHQITEIQKDLQEHDIEISALGYYPNFLYPDAAEAEEACRYFYKVLELASRLEVSVVCTFAGRHPDKSVQENIPLFKDLFSRFCDEAESRNLRIAIENCAMMEHLHMRGGNIAFSPEVWDEMFKAVPSKALGIELDPSHMVWQGIDYIQAVYDYGDRIFHIHAKDMEIRRKKLARVGVLGQQFGETGGFNHGWWRPRTPGWGEIDWQAFITALLEVNYRGNIDIEHEDDTFEMSGILGKWDAGTGVAVPTDNVENWFFLGFSTLSRLIPPEVQ